MLVTLDQYFLDPATGKDRRLEYVAEFTDNFPQGVAHVADFLKHLDQLLRGCGVSSVRVTGGWAPPSLHKHAPHSGHIDGAAIDLGLDGGLYQKVAAHPDLLKVHEMWLEDITSAKTHVHIDRLMRRDRPSRTFKA